MAKLTVLKCEEFLKFGLCDTEQVDVKYKKRGYIIFCIFIAIFIIATIVNTYDQLNNHNLFNYKIYVKQVYVAVDFLFIAIEIIFVYYSLPIFVRTISADGFALSILRNRLIIYGNKINLENIRRIEIVESMNETEIILYNSDGSFENMKFKNLLPSVSYAFKEVSKLTGHFTKCTN